VYFAKNVAYFPILILGSVFSDCVVSCGRLQVSAYAPNVGTVAERCASVWVEGRVSELQERHRALVQSLDVHDSRLDDVRRRLTGLVEGVAALDRWIAGTVGAVGRHAVIVTGCAVPPALC